MEDHFDHLLRSAQQNSVLISRAQIALGRMLLAIKEREPAETYWGSVQRIGLSATAAQLAMKLAALAEADPAAESMPIDRLFHRLAHGHPGRINDLWDIFSGQLECALDELLSTDSDRN